MLSRWFKAEGASDGLGLEGDELQRYKSGVTKTVTAIVLKETDAIAIQLDELVKGASLLKFCSLF